MNTALIIAEMTISGVYFLFLICTKIHILYISLSMVQCYNE